MSVKKFSILLLLMNICICIYDIPFDWKYVKRHIGVLPGLFIYSAVMQLWLPGIFMILFGFIFYKTEVRTSNLTKVDTWTLKILYIIAGSVIIQLVFSDIHEFKENLIKVCPVYFLSGLTVLIFYEYFLINK